jgi:hypothetical protein
MIFSEISVFILHIYISTHKRLYISFHYLYNYESNILRVNAVSLVVEAFFIFFLFFLYVSCVPSLQCLDSLIYLLL